MRVRYELAIEYKEKGGSDWIAHLNKYGDIWGIDCWEVSCFRDFLIAKNIYKDEDVTDLSKEMKEHYGEYMTFNIACSNFSIKLFNGFRQFDISTEFLLIIGIEISKLRDKAENRIIIFWC